MMSVLIARSWLAGKAQSPRNVEHLLFKGCLEYGAIQGSIHVVRQLHPDVKPTVRDLPTGPIGEVDAHGLIQHPAFVRIPLAKDCEMLIISASFDNCHHQGLEEIGGAKIMIGFDKENWIHQIIRQYAVPDSESRGIGLAECAGEDDTPAMLFKGQGCGHGMPHKSQMHVGRIFEIIESVASRRFEFLKQVQYFQLIAGRCCETGWVLEIGHSIKEFQAGNFPIRLQRMEQLIEGPNVHSLGIYWDAAHLDTSVFQQAQHDKVCGILDNHHISFVQHHLAEEVEKLLGSVRDHKFRRRYRSGSCFVVNGVDLSGNE